MSKCPGHSVPPGTGFISKKFVRLRRKHPRPCQPVSQTSRTGTHPTPHPILQQDPNPMALRGSLSCSQSQMACKRNRGEQTANTVSVSLPPHSWVPLPALMCSAPRRRKIPCEPPRRLRQERRSASSLGKPFRQPPGTTLWLVLTITIPYPN